MYGTIVHVRVKTGCEEEFLKLCGEIGIGRVPGQRALFIYQMDSNSRDFYIVIIFHSHAAYLENFLSPLQYERFARFTDLLDWQPEWHDGQIILNTI